MEQQRQARPKRVLEVGMTRNWGGLETYLMQQFRHLDPARVHYDFVNITGEYDICFQQEILDAGSEVFRVCSRHRNPLRHYREWYQLLRHHAGAYDAIVLNTNSLEYVYPLVIARKFGIPRRVIHSHNAGFENAIGTARRALIAMNQRLLRASATDYLACSEDAGRWMFGTGTPFRVVHNALDMASYRFDPARRAAVRQSLGLGDALVLGHVGRFSYQKNHDFLLDAFAAVHEARPDTVLLLVGDAVGDTSFLDATKEKVERLGLKENVRFLGMRQDVPDLLQAMDVFLLPSHFEGLGIVGIEAQAAGLPTFASDTLPRDLAVTSLIHFLPLGRAEAWAEAVLHGGGQPRRDTTDEIRRAGYDIDEETRKMEEFFCSN